MPFPPGSKSPGRPRGPKGIRGLLRAVEVLAELGKHPISELVKLADSTDDEKLAAQIWMELQKYAEAPQKEPAPIIPDTPEQSVENAAITFEKLQAYAIPLEPKPND